MRLLERDKQPFWYANYTGREMLHEGQYVTGERNTEYSEPAQAYGTFSINTGAATPRDFGTYIDYDYVIHMDSGPCPFDENAGIWLNHTTDQDPDYRVLRISELRTHTAVAIRQMR